MTPKEEALELLGVENRTYAQDERLNDLTNTASGLDGHSILDFTHNLDSCFYLLKTLRCDWHINIVPGFNDSPEIIIGSQQEFYAIAKAYTASAVAIEMLRGYWTMQPD